ncbi:MAG: transporter substrate-binding domain-containing protein [Gallionellaceae bacterium]|jgi:membrane-bound lytic murein transglycosylase F|nr:transporter substrate-binding domain-containing protein [Gallionellaceae bacterium]
MRLPTTLIVLLCCALLAACLPSEPTAKPWRQELTVAVTQDQGSVEAEFRQQLITLFAQELNLRVRLVPLPPDRIVSALLSGRVHFAAVGMRADTSSGLRFAPAYQTVSEHLTCLIPPRKLQNLIEKNITVISDSAQEQALRELQETLPDLQWETRTTGTVADLLEEVADGKL